MTVSLGWRFLLREEPGADTCHVACCRDFYVLDLTSFLVAVSAAPGRPWWLHGIESACQCRRCGCDHWVSKISWRRKCNPLQYSCLENPRDGGAWWATVHESQRVGHDWVTSLSNTRDSGLIPGQGAKIIHASQPKYRKHKTAAILQQRKL